MTEATGSGETGNPDGAPAPDGQAAETTSTPSEGFLSTIQDTDLRGWAENKGISEGEQALSSYRNLEKMFGADKAGRTVTLLGDDPTPEAQAAFYNKLGRPEDAAGYELAVPEGNDGAFAKLASEKFHELGITGKQGAALAEWWNEQAGGAVEQSEADYNAAVESDTAELRKEWGAAYDKNINDAKAAATKFGLDEKAVDAMEKALGFGGVMRHLNKIGAQLGEDSNDGNDENVGSGLMTPQSAQSALNELYGNKEFMEAWMDKNHPGHAGALAKKERLSKMVMGHQP